VGEEGDQGGFFFLANLPNYLLICLLTEDGCDSQMGIEVEGGLPPACERTDHFCLSARSGDLGRFRLRGRRVDVGIGASAEGP
jgi:hypothetical protein